MLNIYDMKFIKKFDLFIHLVVIGGLWIKYNWAVALFCGSVVITLDQILSVLRYRMMKNKDNA